MTLIVEMVGLPGSGKSTLASRAAERLREQGLAATVETSVPGGRWQKLATYGAYLSRHPGHVVHSLGATLASRQASPSDLRRALVTWLKRSARAVPSGDAGDVRLVDAGMFQALWSIAYSSRAEDPLKRFRESPHFKSWPDLVFVVEVQPQTASDRLNHRSGRTSRLERDLESGIAALPTALAALRATLEVVATHADEGRRFEVVQLRNEVESDSEKNARTIVENVLERLPVQRR